MPLDDVLDRPQAAIPPGVKTAVAIIGLGYVGLPLAVAMARRRDVVGIDIDPGRIAELSEGHDRTGEITPERLRASPLRLSADITHARHCGVLIVTVPTPVDGANLPDLGPVLGATRGLAGVLEPGAGTIIVYESTVYPGVTEEICGPLIEQVSGLRHGVDFFLGYSPERINPGDREHSVERITKVVAGDCAQTLDTLAALYGAITTGGVFRAASIKAAEAAKVIENAQRDINIAFMNEITQIFSKLGLSIHDVLDAARTKWNFLPFTPGLVGGHCIGVDPYYLAHRAQMLGHDPKVILSGRSINDAMGTWIADQLHDRLRTPSRILVLGLTFKENVPDLRNSKVVDMIRRLEWLGHSLTVHDPLANPIEATQEYGLTLTTNPLDQTNPNSNDRYDALVLAVPHTHYTTMTPDQLANLTKPGATIADLKNITRGMVIENRKVWVL